MFTKIRKEWHAVLGNFTNEASNNDGGGGEDWNIFQQSLHLLQAAGKSVPMTRVQK